MRNTATRSLLALAIALGANGACTSHKTATAPAPEAADTELAAAPEVAPAPAAERGAEEIIVTAQKRESRWRGRIASDAFASPSIAAQPELHTEGYARIDESGFRATASAPLSTFSIDVDTASYSNVRRMLQEGRLPPRQAIRHLFEAFLVYASGGKKYRGCFLTNTALELAAHDATVRNIVANSQAEIEAFFVRMCTRAKERGDAPAALDPTATARGPPAPSRRASAPSRTADRT